MIHSAGIIIIDDKGPETKALCVSVYGNWDFPKGQLEAGESHLEAAIREVEEETTLKSGTDYLLTGEMAPPVTYGSGKKQKTATYFVAKRISDADPYLPINPELGKPENDKWSFVPVSELSFIMPARLLNISEFIQKTQHSCSAPGP